MKKQILKYIKNHLNQRMKAAWGAMQAAQEAANNESKSSVGDKYETARAMGQLDRDMHARMYEQARQERLFVENIDENTLLSQVTLGAYIQTTIGDLFISISIGKAIIDDKSLMLISSQSPIGALLMGKSVGDKFLFRGKEATILAII